MNDKLALDISHGVTPAVARNYGQLTRMINQMVLPELDRVGLLDDLLPTVAPNPMPRPVVIETKNSRFDIAVMDMESHPGFKSKELFIPVPNQVELR